jgi:hypothetical protein
MDLEKIDYFIEVSLRVTRQIGPFWEILLNKGRTRRPFGQHDLWAERVSGLDATSAPSQELVECNCGWAGLPHHRVKGDR